MPPTTGVRCLEVIGGGTGDRGMGAEEWAAEELEAEEPKVEEPEAEAVLVVRSLGPCCSLVRIGECVFSECFWTPASTLWRTGGF